MKTSISQQEAREIKRIESLRGYHFDPQRNVITSPGKFEGEPIFTPYYWAMGLQGFADSDDGRAYGFRFTNDGEDFAIWPELKKWLGRKRSFKLVEDSQGFVHCF